MRRPRATAIVCALACVPIACTDYGVASDPGIDASADRTADDAAVAANDAYAEADAGIVCPAETCAGRQECVLFDFASGCDVWTFTGNLTDTTHDCVGGKLHLAATATRDIVAQASFPTPSLPYRVGIAMRVGMSAWSGDVAGVAIGGNALGRIRAEHGIGDLRFRLCDGFSTACAPSEVAAAPNVEHLLVIDITSTSVSAALDCRPIGTLPVGQTLPTKSTLDVELGTLDANPIDGTFDDVLVSYGLP